MSWPACLPSFFIPQIFNERQASAENTAGSRTGTDSDFMMGRTDSTPVNVLETMLSLHTCPEDKEVLW